MRRSLALQAPPAPLTGGAWMLQDILYKFGAAAKKAVFGDGALAPSLAKAARGANPKKPLTTAVIRTYYIQAEEREWVCLLSSHPTTVSCTLSQQLLRCTCTQLTTGGRETLRICRAEACLARGALLISAELLAGGHEPVQSERVCGRRATVHQQVQRDSGAPVHQGEVRGVHQRHIQDRVRSPVLAGPPGALHQDPGGTAASPQLPPGACCSKIRSCACSALCKACACKLFTMRWHLSIRPGNCRSPS